jgi:hypothetical protein
MPAGPDRAPATEMILCFLNYVPLLHQRPVRKLLKKMSITFLADIHWAYADCHSISFERISLKKLLMLPGRPLPEPKAFGII